MAETILELKNIVKTFPGVKALDDINFTLKRGEIHAICGENGAGKSTLMKVVCGVHQPDCGEMIVDGCTQEFCNPMEAYESGVSIIFQETSLFEEMTVLDNIFLGHEIQKKIGPVSIIDYEEMKKRAEEIFGRLNTEIDLYEQIKNLGIAQKQMVEIAKALTFDSSIIIFDEPTASLTQREVTALFNIIRNLKKENLGIVYISHRLEEIFELCDRITVLRDGQYVSTKNTKDTNKDELVADMVGRKIESYYPKTTTEIGDEIFRVESYYDEDFITDVSFHVKKGEILGFAGLAGAGRTELMKSICGFTRKASGQVYIDNEKLEITNYKDAMNYGIVYVTEDRGKFGLVKDFSVERNITLPQLDNFSTKWFFLDRQKETQIAEKYMEDIDIKAPDSTFLVKNLSGGNQQKVSIARALALEPKILILDEPTRGVDVNAKAEIYKIISELTQIGLTVIMVSSELPELIGMSDRIYVMKDGTIAGCFNRDEATQEKILAVELDTASA